MSAATAMRRRNTRGSSASSTSSPPSPRSTVTPPPSSSSGSSSPGSSGTPPTPDVYPLQSPLEYMGKWNSLASEVSLFDDVQGLSLSGSNSRSSPAFSHSPTSESQMANMFMHNSFGDFLDPSIDPSTLASLHPTAFSLDSCTSPHSMLPETIDPWSTAHFPYPDFNGAGLPMEPPQLTPSMSSTGTSSVNSTPQLGQQQYATNGWNFGRFMSLQEPQIAFNQFGAGIPDRTAMHFLQSQIDPHDHRAAVALAMCDPYDVSSSMSLHHAYSAAQ